MDTKPAVPELLAAARKGDRRAEDDLFHILHHKIHKFVSYKIWMFGPDAAEHRRNAEDLVQDICLCIFTKYHNIALEYDFVPWALSVACNKTRDYNRKLFYRNTRHSALDTGQKTQSLIDHSASAEGAMEVEELEHNINTVTKNLPRTYRAILLALREERIKEYVARQTKLKVHLPTLYSHICRCRQHLRKHLHRRGFEV